MVEYKKEVLVARLEKMAETNDEGNCVEVSTSGTLGAFYIIHRYAQIRIMPEYMSVNHKPVVCPASYIFSDVNARGSALR